MSNVPIVQSARAAWAFRALHWRRVAGVLGALAACNLIGTAGSVVYEEPPVWVSLSSVAFFALWIMGYMALMRLAFADEHPDDPEFEPGPHGFQWAKPEWRFLGIVTLLGFLGLLGVLFLVFVGMVVVAVGAVGALTSDATPETLWAALGPGGQLTLRLLIVGFLVGAMVISMRLSLAPAATVAHKQILVFQTWALTKGQFLRMFAATVLVVFPPMIASLVLGAIVGAAASLAISGEPDAVNLPTALVSGLIPSLISAFVILPLSAGLTAYLYRGLRPAAEAPQDS